MHRVSLWLGVALALLLGSSAAAQDLLELAKKRAAGIPKMTGSIRDRPRHVSCCVRIEFPAEEGKATGRAYLYLVKNKESLMLVVCNGDGMPMLVTTHGLALAVSPSPPHDLMLYEDLHFRIAGMTDTAFDIGLGEAAYSDFRFDAGKSLPSLMEEESESTVDASRRRVAFNRAEPKSSLLLKLAHAESIGWNGIAEIQVKNAGLGNVTFGSLRQSPPTYNAISSPKMGYSKLMANEKVESFPREKFTEEVGKELWSRFRGTAPLSPEYQRATQKLHELMRDQLDEVTGAIAQAIDRFTLLAAADEFDAEAIAKALTGVEWGIHFCLGGDVTHFQTVPVIADWARYPRDSAADNLRLLLGGKRCDYFTKALLLLASGRKTSDELAVRSIDMLGRIGCTHGMETWTQWNHGLQGASDSRTRAWLWCQCVLQEGRGEWQEMPAVEDLAEYEWALASEALACGGQKQSPEWYAQLVAKACGAADLKSSRVLRALAEIPEAQEAVANAIRDQKIDKKLLTDIAGSFSFATSKPSPAHDKARMAFEELILDVDVKETTRRRIAAYLARSVTSVKVADALVADMLKSDDPASAIACLSLPEEQLTGALDRAGGIAQVVAKSTPTARVVQAAILETIVAAAPESSLSKPLCLDYCSQLLPHEDEACIRILPAIAMLHADGEKIPEATLKKVIAIVGASKSLEASADALEFLHVISNRQIPLDDRPTGVDAKSRAKWAENRERVVRAANEWLEKSRR